MNVLDENRFNSTMSIGWKVHIFNQKILEYYLSCLPSAIRQLGDTSFLQRFPLYEFDIERLFRIHTEGKMLSSNMRSQLGNKLIDTKLVYCYLLTTGDLFLRGPTLIVGNNELDKLNPNTLSLLRGNHYRVYLISVLVENLLDLMQLVFLNEIHDHKKGKWEKIILEVKGRTGQEIVTDANEILLREFREQYRTAELHKFSAVRAFTARGEWNHFQREENAIREIITNLSNHILHQTGG